MEAMCTAFQWLGAKGLNFPEKKIISEGNQMIQNIYELLQLSSYQQYTTTF